MSFLQQHTGPSSEDRLSLTISVAVLIHVLIIFGINFTREDRPNMRFNTMEIVLVKQETKAIPELPRDLENILTK